MSDFDDNDVYEPREIESELEALLAPLVEGRREGTIGPQVYANGLAEVGLCVEDYESADVGLDDEFYARWNEALGLIAVDSDGDSIAQTIGDLRRLAEKHVPRLREAGLDELADMIEDLTP